MKKLTSAMCLFLFVTLLACGGKTEKETSSQEKSEPTSETTQVAEPAADEPNLDQLDKASDEIVEKAEEINQQLDSLLNEI